MVVKVGEIVAHAQEWVGATDVVEHLGSMGVPEADITFVQEKLAAHRLGLIRTAASLAILEHHEAAARDLQLARTLLGVLGENIGEDEQSVEEEPDRLLSIDDFRSCAPERSRIPKRLWSAIMRQHDELVYARQQLNVESLDKERAERLKRQVALLERFDGLVKGNRMSLRRFKELAQLGLITGRDISEGGILLVDEIAKLEIEPEAPVA